MSEDLKIPPMPEPPFGLTGYVGRDGNEIITINRAGFDDVARWGEQGWSEAQTQARRADEAETLNATLRQEAQIHAMESRTYRTIVEECYQIATGATGEPGTWNGAAPIRALAAERDALKARVAEMEDGSFAKRQGATLETYRIERNEARVTLAQRDREVLALRSALEDLIPDAEANHIGGWDTEERLVAAREALASTAQAGADAERRVRQEERERCRPFMHHEADCYYGWKGGVIGGPEHCTCGLAAILGTEPNP